MKALFKFALCLLVMHSIAENVYALTILSPKEGEIVYAGSELNIVVKPDASEKWENVAFGFYPMTYNSLTSLYTYTFTMPSDIQGYYDRIVVIGVDKSGNEVELKRRVFVKIPPNIDLQSIEVDQYKTLYKLPDGSPPQDIQRIESRQLRVYGKYSDGVERKLTSSALGTTYTSSNETVVTVDKEGKIIAQGIGKAKIWVRNGNFNATVDVVVKPYKK